MRTSWIVLSLVWLCSYLLPHTLWAATTLPTKGTVKPVIELNVQSEIGPATYDYIKRSIAVAKNEDAQLIIIRINSPGGLLSIANGIDRVILASPIPVATFVSPTGARLANSGVIILYASHIAAMAPGTQLGSSNPTKLPGLDVNNSPNLALKHNKRLKDTELYLQSLAKLRDHNPDFASKALSESLSLPAEQALKINVIDYIANDVPDLLNQLNGKIIKMNNGAVSVLATKDAPLVEINPSWRYRIIFFITDPGIAFILFLIGIYGIFFEISNPGFFIPGITGSLALIAAIFALALLPINYAALTMLLMGITFIVGEMVVTSYGLLGLAGVALFLYGSYTFYDASYITFKIALPIIVIMCIITCAFFFLSLYLTTNLLRLPLLPRRNHLIGSEGEVLEYHADYVMVRVQGEIWSAQCKQRLNVGQIVVVKDVNQLTLQVEPITCGKDFIK